MSESVKNNKYEKRKEKKNSDKTTGLNRNDEQVRQSTHDDI